MRISMSNYTIYHNPRCSKSRQTLEILEQKGIQPEVVLYLEDTPTKHELAALITKLNLTARDLLRKGEQAYKDLSLSNPELTDESLLDTMVQHPKLIERPIVVYSDKAALGRPPENVLELIN